MKPDNNELKLNYFAALGHFLQRLPCLYFLQQSFFLSNEVRKAATMQPPQECTGFFSLFTVQMNKSSSYRQIPF
jgi:hypothetical protein